MTFIKCQSLVPCITFSVDLIHDVIIKMSFLDEKTTEAKMLPAALLTYERTYGHSSGCDPEF